MLLSSQSGIYYLNLNCLLTELVRGFSIMVKKYYLMWVLMKELMLLVSKIKQMQDVAMNLQLTP